MAETFAMVKGTESGCRLRAAIVDMYGKLNMRNWEESAASQMGHLWVTDCASLYEHLMAPRMNSIDNKRLAIDLMGLRQQVWECDGDRTLEVDTSRGDYPKWIDTSAMIADPLTKLMKPTQLCLTMTTGNFDMRPTPESIAIKERNRASRRKTRIEEETDRYEGYKEYAEPPEE